MKNMRKAVGKVAKLSIRSGDRVKVLAGKYRNKEGVVVKVFPARYRAIVEGVNQVVKHLKASSENPKGAIERREASLHISNLMLIDPESGLPTRIGRRYNEVGKLQRYAKKSGKFIQND